VVDLVPDQPLPQPVPLADIKADAILQRTPLVRIPRLSVVPLTTEQLQRLLALAAR
jgi:predicted RNA-binding protein with PUA-like domain